MAASQPALRRRRCSGCGGGKRSPVGPRRKQNRTAAKPPVRRPTDNVPTVLGGIKEQIHQITLTRTTRSP